MTTVILFIFGAVIGSFLNVVGLRWDLKNFGGRSHCLKCGKVLGWRELVPILSFFWLRGKCSGCKEKISWQYPAIEIFTGLIFATVPYIFLPVFCIYVVILIYDFKHKIIPDALVYISIVLAFLTSYFLLPSPFSFFDWLAGPILFVFFGSIWLFSRGRAMGFGDAKLGLSIGFLLGAAQSFSAIVLAFWIGASISLLYILLGKTGFIKNPKRLTMKSEIPFAPFIFMGAWISLIFQLDLLHVLSF